MRVVDPPCLCVARAGKKWSHSGFGICQGSRLENDPSLRNIVSLKLLSFVLMFHPIRRFKRFLWVRLMERMHLNWNLRSGVRVIIRSYADWCSYNEVFANDEYTVPIREVIAAGARPLRVLDLGANFGYFTLRLADQIRQEWPTDDLSVWMVEASPSVCTELRRRMDFSNAKMKWSVTNGLVGKRTGTARLNYAVEDNQNFVDESARREFWARTGDAEELNYVDLAALVKDEPVIDLIKCDIEGSEYDFLQSYPDLLKKTARLVIEFHAAFGDIVEAVRRVEEAGFGRSVVLREDAHAPVIYFSRV